MDDELDEPVVCSCGAEFLGGYRAWGMHVLSGLCPEPEPSASTGWRWEGREGA